MSHVMTMHAECAWGDHADYCRECGLLTERDSLRAKVVDLERGTALAKLRAELGDATRRVASLEEQLRLATTHGFSEEAEANDLRDQLTALNERALEQERRLAELEAANAEAASAIRDLEGQPITYATARRLALATRRLDAARAEETTT